MEPFRISRGASLAIGSAGLALFYSYLSRAHENRDLFANEADRYLSRACDALERYPAPGAKKLLELLIVRLEQLATHSDQRIAWFTNPEIMPRRTETYSSGGSR